MAAVVLAGDLYRGRDQTAAIVHSFLSEPVSGEPRAFWPALGEWEASIPMECVWYSKLDLSSWKGSGDCCI